MKKYISILIITFIISIFILLGVNLYIGRDVYQQYLNNFLVKVGIKDEEKNIFDPKTTDTRNFKTHVTDFYVFYYPENYQLNVLENSLIFFKDFNQIAVLKIINLNSEKSNDFEKVSGNYFFTQDKDLQNIMNLPEFYNKYIVLKDESIKKGDTTFLISHDEYNNNSKELVFKKYIINSYDFFNDFKIIGFYDPENILDNIIIYTDNKLLVVGYLSMPSMEELNFFTNLIIIINKGYFQSAN